MEHAKRMYVVAIKINVSYARCTSGPNSDGPHLIIQSPNCTNQKNQGGQSQVYCELYFYSQVKVFTPVLKD